MPIGPHLPFSQRTGLEIVPPQLKLGEVSADLRRIINYYVSLEIDRSTRFGFEHSYFDDGWQRVTMDLHVLFFGKDASSYANSPYDWKEALKKFINLNEIGKLFDLIEFLAAHQKCSDEMKRELSQTFIHCRAGISTDR